MIKKYIFLIMVALLPSLAFAEKVLGTLTLTTPTVAAICVYDTDAKTATLGNGYTSCINHYEVGELAIPGSTTFRGESYKVVVGEFAFRLCNQLLRVTINEGVEHIGDYAFVGCSSVTSITLPASLKTIGAGAFCKLDNLKTMRCKSTAAPTWQWNDVFSVLGTKESMKEKALERVLFIPAGNLDNYNNSKFDGTSTAAKEKVGWQEAFARIYELSEEPYAITSKEEFIAFRDRVNNGTMLENYKTTNFKLTADLDLSGGDWTPIGTINHAFSGIFDGGGHVIKNLKIGAIITTTLYQGLFGYADNATIYNMHLLNPVVSGGDYVGSVVGYVNNDSHITDVLVISNASSSDDYTVKANYGSGGGIVGYAKNATIERCMFRGQVKCSGWTGGIVGNVFNNVTVTDCSASNFLMCFDNSNSVIGGIVGGAGSVNVNRCFARSTFLWYGIASDCLGKIVGKTNNAVVSSITNCAYWKANADVSVLGYDQYSKLSASGNVKYSAESDMTQDKTKSVLGTENWYYFTGNYVDYPVPLTLKDMYINTYVDVVGGDGFVYRPVGDASYEIVKYTGSDGSVTIPDTYNKKPVTGIASGVFEENQTLTSITFGSNIASIGDRAFYDCDALTSVSLPNSVTYVGERAFGNCDKLTSFHIGTGFKDHKGNFLAYCPMLTTLTVADGNTNGYISVDNVLIHDVPSYGSYIVVCAPGKLGDYVIPTANFSSDRVYLMDNCFASCDGLTSITFPAAPGKKYNLSVASFNEAYSLRYVDMSNVDGFFKVVNYPVDTNVTVDRGDPQNPFYGMSEYTMIYLPAGNSAADGEVNAVIGNSANRLMLTENWDFVPRVAPITAINGVSFNRILEPTFIEYLTETDEKVEIDGEMVEAQEATYEYAAKGYASCLPYPVTLTNENVKVYYPTSTKTIAGGSGYGVNVTTVIFTEVEDKKMAANTPYYIVVSGDDNVDLSTDETVIVTDKEAHPRKVGGFEYRGTLTAMPNSVVSKAERPIYVLQDEGNWLRVKADNATDSINPYCAYLQVVDAQTGDLPETIATLLKNNYPDVTILDGEDNSALFAQYKGQKVNATYNRVFSATDNGDGTWKSRAYTVCLPFSVDLRYESLEHGFEAYYARSFDAEKGELIFIREMMPVLDAGKAYLLKVGRGSFNIHADGVELIDKALEGEPVMDMSTEDYNVLGYWRGTLTKIESADAAAVMAYSFQGDGKFKRIRPDTPQAWWGAFRGMYCPIALPSTNVLTPVFMLDANGDGIGDEELPLPDGFDGDTDIPDDIDGIKTVNSQGAALDQFHDLSGRRVNGKPTQKGLYINNGKKIIVK